MLDGFLIDGLGWVGVLMGIAFYAAGLAFFFWVFGVGDKMRAARQAWTQHRTDRLVARAGQPSEEDDIEQRLNDALRQRPPAR